MRMSARASASAIEEEGESWMSAHAEYEMCDISHT